MDHERLLRMLTRLKLTAIRDQLDNLLDEAAKRELSLREALAFLVEREIARKDERRIEMSLGLARFPFVRELDGFDFAAQPSLDKQQIRELATGRFVANGEAVLLLGPPGVGKTHLAVALGRQAILAGYTVQFRVSLDIRFHTPLIEPDMQVCRIRLSDKTSRLRPRRAPTKPCEAYEPKVPVKVREGIT